MGAISKNQTNSPNFEVMQIFPKLSSQLEDAIIANIDLYVFFIKDLNTFKGNAASIKVKTSLRLVSTDYVSAKSDDKGMLMRKDVEFASGTSQIDFVSGRYNVGGSVETIYSGTLKKDIAIDGVLDDTVIQSFAKGSVDFTGTDTYFGKLYEAENKSSPVIKELSVEVNKYKTG